MLDQGKRNKSGLTNYVSMSAIICSNCNTACRLHNLHLFFLTSMFEFPLIEHLAFDVETVNHEVDIAC
jgi:hypothetical protein